MTYRVGTVTAPQGRVKSLGLWGDPHVYAILSTEADAQASPTAALEASLMPGVDPKHLDAW